MFQFFKIVLISKLGSSSIKKLIEETNYKVSRITTIDFFKVGLRTSLVRPKIYLITAHISYPHKSQPQLLLNKRL